MKTRTIITYQNNMPKKSNKDILWSKIEVLIEERDFFLIDEKYKLAAKKLIELSLLIYKNLKD